MNKAQIEKTCENCKHEDKAATEYPCSSCIHNATEKFEPKPREINGWTPCSDHNPEESGYYLVYYDYGMQGVTEYSKRHDAWNACDDSDHKEYEIKYVVAWRELPADYAMPEPEVIEHEN